MSIDENEKKMKKILNKERIFELEAQKIGLNNYIDLVISELSKYTNKIENLQPRLLEYKDLKKQYDRSVISVEMNIQILIRYINDYLSIAKKVLK